MTTNKKNKRKQRRLIQLSIIVGVTGYLGYILYNQQVTLNKLNQEQIFYSKQLGNGYQQTKDIKRTKEMCKSDEYIEKVSREQLGMVKPDEKVYIDATK